MLIDVKIPERNEFKDMLRATGQEVTDTNVANLAYGYSNLDRLANTLGVDPSQLSASKDSYTTFNGNTYLKEGAIVTLERSDSVWGNLNRPFQSTLTVNNVKAFLGLELTEESNLNGVVSYNLVADDINEEIVLNFLEDSAVASYLTVTNPFDNTLVDSLSFYDSALDLNMARPFDLETYEPEENKELTNNRRSEEYYDELFNGPEPTVFLSYFEDENDAVAESEALADAAPHNYPDEIVLMANDVGEYDKRTFGPMPEKNDLIANRKPSVASRPTLVASW